MQNGFLSQKWKSKLWYINTIKQPQGDQHQHDTERDRTLQAGQNQCCAGGKDCEPDEEFCFQSEYLDAAALFQLEEALGGKMTGQVCAQNKAKGYRVGD